MKAMITLIFCVVGHHALAGIQCRPIRIEPWPANPTVYVSPAEGPVGTFRVRIERGYYGYPTLTEFTAPLETIGVAQVLREKFTVLSILAADQKGGRKGRIQSQDFGTQDLICGGDFR